MTDQQSATGWFDAHVIIGEHPEQPPPTGDSLDDHLRRYGLDGALVGSLGSWLHDPLTGNTEASAVAERTGHADVRACWTAVPPTPGELTDLPGLARAAAERSVVAFRLYPHTHGYPITDPVWHRFFDELTGLGLPLCLNRTEVSWAEIDRIGSDHPELPMIISLVGYRELRVIATQLERHPAVHLDLVNFASHQGVEWLVDSFGADRLLFGTGFGTRDPGESVARLAWSDLSSADRRTVGSTNARRLFGAAR